MSFQIFQEYQDLKEVFNKARATSLPPHRPYDCAVNLLPGTSPPLFSLSTPETKAMERYINDSLAAGIICPTSSPAGAGFFLVDKKNKTLLRPCIDYRGLNNITIKNRYPLPLISFAFELLQGATVFTKLDLRNAYHLVRIREGDEWKTAFNTSGGHYEYLVMPFWTLLLFSRLWWMMCYGIFSIFLSLFTLMISSSSPSLNCRIHWARSSTPLTQVERQREHWWDFARAIGVSLIMPLDFAHWQPIVAGMRSPCLTRSCMG